MAGHFFKTSPGAPSRQPLWLELLVGAGLAGTLAALQAIRGFRTLSPMPAEAAPPRLSWFGLIRQTFTEWNAHGAPRLGAALAFYSVLSIGPLLLIAIAVAGLAFGHDRASTFLIGELRDTIGMTGARAVEEILVHSQNPTRSVIATIVGTLALLVSASGFFGQLQSALNQIWDAPNIKPGAGAIVRRRMLSFGMVLGICVMLLFSLVISAGLSAVTAMFSDALPAFGLQVLSWALSLAVTTVLFALTFKILPDVAIEWREVWLGAFVTALLFTVGKSLIGLYLGRSALSSTYGAAGSMIILLVWLYYSAQIYFLGAEFTHVYARHRGRG